MQVVSDFDLSYFYSKLYQKVADLGGSCQEESHRSRFLKRHFNVEYAGIDLMLENSEHLPKKWAQRPKKEPAKRISC